MDLISLIALFPDDLFHESSGKSKKQLILNVITINR